ncbi:MAG: UDP-3-O-(3-hydroxymyristoyl)glucosamine N-acyltransferase [candidate division Zixibacteria bacterium]|nr:UDP-3-O-(3-hydroxymyristoyl)glucosamine N-acyltransferase [candidate division Zixibacteria bacterium]
MPKTVAELANIVGGDLSGDGAVVISSAAPIANASSGDITFIANTKYAKYLDTTAASAVVLPVDIPFDRIPVIRHQNSYYAFALILDALYPESRPYHDGVSSTAEIDISAIIGDQTTIGPLAFVGANSKIGSRTHLAPQVFVGRDVKIGNDCRLYPRAVILDGTVIGDRVTIHSGTVVGSDGFGYARHDKGIKKIKQVGNVIIEDDVEIGANVTVDRGALGPTKIGRGTKIDNLVQIAHNVEIGQNCIIVAQVGISGSTKLGNGVILAGQVGLVGHIEIGDGVMIGAQSGVNHSIPAGKSYFGYPARELIEAKRIEASVRKLPDLFKRVRALEKKQKP